MKAGEATLQKILNTSRQFIIPIFQRNFSWEKKQFKQLWTDIQRASKFTRERTHFIGSIVYIDMGTPAGRPQQLMLIDGQQRLTTLSLLLCALKRYVQKNNVETNLIKTKKIDNQFLLNSDEMGDDKYKLLLNAQDRETYIKLLEQTEFTVNTPSKRIMNCYEYFYQQIEKCADDLNSIFLGILNLSLVAISLDKDKDNPQLIFESMNSTGKDLAQSDLLRNYLLMDLSTKEQNRLYTTYWKPMEDAFGQYAYLEKFDYFIRDFLTIKQNNGRICKVNDVYEQFKRYYIEQNLTKEDILKEIFMYAKYYAAIELDREKDKDLRMYWRQIRMIDCHVAYPFFLQLYHDYEQKNLAKEDFILIIKTTISYIVRRAICEIPTNSLNKTFAVFYNKINKQDYVNSVLKEYILKTAYRAFPTDYEVREKLQTKDIYHFRLKNYLLEMLENYYHKEPIDIVRDNYTIEHIMPQSPELNMTWQKMLGENWREVQKIYLHTLGNLTLTGYNSEMGNKSFEEKLNGENGFKHSHLKLNQYVASCEAWNKKSIQQRTSLLTDLILKIWSYPVFKNK